MTTPDTAPPLDIDPDAPVLLEPVPPDEAFWAKHNRNLEMPTSLAVSALAMAAMFLGLVLVMWFALGAGPQKPEVPISLAGIGGEDDTGEGTANAGGGGGPQDKLRETPPAEVEPIQPPTPPDAPLPQAVAPNEQVVTDDPTANAVASTATATSFSGLDAALAQKLTGANPGQGNGPGTEGTGVNAGPPGTGNDGSRARSLRWVIRFVTSDGRDYLDQLSAMGAVVMVAVPPDNKQMYIFRDLAKPKPGTIATDTDLAQFGGQVHFSDQKRDSVAGVAKSLGLTYTPSEFYAFFPKGIENELAALERDFAGRAANDIGETKFQATLVGGKYKFRVLEQSARR